MAHFTTPQITPPPQTRPCYITLVSERCRAAFEYWMFLSIYFSILITDYRICLNVIYLYNTNFLKQNNNNESSKNTCMLTDRVKLWWHCFHYSLTAGDRCTEQSCCGPVWYQSTTTNLWRSPQINPCESETREKALFLKVSCLCFHWWTDGSLLLWSYRKCNVFVTKLAKLH